MATHAEYISAITHVKNTMRRLKNAKDKRQFVEQSHSLSVEVIHILEDMIPKTSLPFSDLSNIPEVAVNLDRDFDNSIKTRLNSTDFYLLSNPSFNDSFEELFMSLDELLICLENYIKPRGIDEHNFNRRFALNYDKEILEHITDTDRLRSIKKRCQKENSNLDNEVIRLIDLRIQQLSESLTESDKFRHIFTPEGYSTFTRCIEKYGTELTDKTHTDWCAIYFGLSDLKLLSNTSELRSYVKELPDLYDYGSKGIITAKYRNDIADSTLDKWHVRLNEIEK